MIKNLYVNEKNVEGLNLTGINVVKSNTDSLTFPSIDRVWMKWYDEKSQQEIDILKSKYNFLYDYNQDNLDDIAINNYGNLITYGEFFQNCRNVGLALNHFYADENSVVTLLLPTMPRTYYALYGCDYISSIVNPVDIRSSFASIKHYINDCGSEYLFVHELMGSQKFYDKILSETSVKHIVVVPSPIESLPKSRQLLGQKILQLKDKTIRYDGDKIVRYAEFLGFKDYSTFDRTKFISDPNKVSVLMHTSGTTGKMPKTVKASDKNINFMAAQYMKSLMDLKRGQISLDIMPKWIFYGYLGVHMPLSIGMTVVPVADPTNEKFDDLINRFHPQNVAGVPNHAIQLINNPKITDISCINTLGIGGDSMPYDFELNLNELLQTKGSINYCSPGYGASENTSIGTANQRDVYKAGSVGIPFPDVDCMIIDEKVYEQTGKLVEVGYNTDGIICLAGNLMLGYDKDHDEEYDKVIRIGENMKKWYVSGDIGYLDTDGFLFYKNRGKDLIVGADGFKIVPKLIEDTVLKHPSVERCIVVGKKIDDSMAGDYPSCYIVLKDKSAGVLFKAKVKKEIIEILKENVSSYYMPQEYNFLKSIPITDMGKVDRETLKHLQVKVKKHNR